MNAKLTDQDIRNILIAPERKPLTEAEWQVQRKQKDRNTILFIVTPMFVATIVSTIATYLWWIH